MKNLLNFNKFSISESTAAGNRELSYNIPFSYSSNDPREGYNSKSFVSDLKALFLDKPQIKKEISEFLSDKLGVSNIDDLENKPISVIVKIIPEIERIIEAGEYEPEMIMPGESLLFIRNKKLENGTTADFYINKKGTKIEVVTEDENGKEKVMMFTTDRFPVGRFGFTEDERKELSALIKAKGN